MSYQVFAQIYDEVMDSSLYDSWLSFVAKFVTDKKARMLELACGTGALAVALKKAGYDVTGLDLSENMLALAMDRSLAEQVALPLIQGDMLDLSEVGSFDVVTCFSDSLCYMPNEEALGQVFKQVYQALTENGQFLFDVHSIYQVDEVFPGYQFHYDREEVTFLWQSYMGESPHSVEHALTFFVYDEATEQYQRFDELHEERTYEIVVYQKLLQQAGFKRIELYADFGEEEISETSPRWFFVCHK